MNEELIFILAFQICIGLECLHNNDMLHYDLNMDTILLDEKSNVKLGNYGWIIMNRKTFQATPSNLYDYIAPEILMERPGTAKSDLWSLGVVLFTTAYKKIPFEGNSLKEKIENMLCHEIKPFTHSGNVTMDSNQITEYSNDFIKLIKALLSPNS